MVRLSPIDKQAASLGFFCPTAPSLYKAQLASLGEFRTKTLYKSEFLGKVSLGKVWISPRKDTWKSPWKVLRKVFGRVLKNVFGIRMFLGRLRRFLGRIECLQKNLNIP